VAVEDEALDRIRVAFAGRYKQIAKNTKRSLAVFATSSAVSSTFVKGMLLRSFFHPWGQAVLVVWGLTFVPVFWNLSFLILGYFDKRGWDRFRW